jgi:competence ComEA-like helix-hairpin-helix protein
LLPALSDRISLVQVEATTDSTEADLLDGLQKRTPNFSAGLGLASAFIAVRKGLTLPPGKKVLVVIDQFERWLRAGRFDDEKGLVAALLQCDLEHVQALLVVRDDAWSNASRFMRALGDPIVEGENCAALDPFDRRHARKILAALGRAFGRLPEEQLSLSEEQDKFLEAAISRLDHHRSILPIDLVQFAESVKSKPWDQETLSELSRDENNRVPPVHSESESTDELKRISVNNATEEELKTLPGIGAAIARSLVQARPFATIEDLLKVKGIGAKNLRQIGPLIRLE